jgi:predicted nucleic acid-binding protein
VNVVVDTSVWSLFLRRKAIIDRNEHVQKLCFLLENETVFLVGIILQEILDGLKSEKQWNTLIKYSQPFPLVDCTRDDFIDAAKYKNRCRQRGIQAGTFDFLITAVCINHHMPLLTADQDFRHISKHCPLILL